MDYTQIEATKAKLVQLHLDISNFEEYYRTKHSLVGRSGKDLPDEIRQIHSVMEALEDEISELSKLLP